MGSCQILWIYIDGITVEEKYTAYPHALFNRRISIEQGIETGQMRVAVELYVNSGLQFLIDFCCRIS